MDPETFMHDRQTFRENLLTWANKLSADSTHDSIRMEIVSELEEMVKEKESTHVPDSCSGDEDHDYCEGYELNDPLAEAGFGRPCSKDGTIRDTLSWASELLKRRQVPVSDVAIILDMLALHIVRLRLTRISEGVVVDPYVDKMDDLARVRHESNQNHANEYLRAIWNRLYDCRD
ncbi:uncharacterized protein N7473_010853, partial [Penicillium subrubescens]